MESVINLLAINGLVNFGTSLFSLAMYILLSLGLYTIAKRRGLNNPWLAWIPFGNVWILGSIADQYQYSVKNKKTSRRKVLLGLQIGLSVVAVILVVAMVAFLFVHLAMRPEHGYSAMRPDLYGYEHGCEYSAEGMSVFGGVLLMLLVFMVCAVISVVSAVFTHIAYYDLYMSCDPSNAVAYLVLGIFFGFLASILVFVCRNKDGGMRPQTPPVDPWQYPPEQPVQPQYQSSVQQEEI